MFLSTCLIYAQPASTFVFVRRAFTSLTNSSTLAEIIEECLSPIPVYSCNACIYLSMREYPETFTLRSSKLPTVLFQSFVISCSWISPISSAYSAGSRANIAEPVEACSCFLTESELALLKSWVDISNGGYLSRCGTSSIMT